GRSVQGSGGRRSEGGGQRRGEIGGRRWEMRGLRPEVRGRRSVAGREAKRQIELRAGDGDGLQGPPAATSQQVTGNQQPFCPEVRIYLLQLISPEVRIYLLYRIVREFGFICCTE